MKTLSRLSARFSHPPEPRDETFSKRGLPPGRLLADENANSAESTSAAASVSSGQHSSVRRQCRPSAYLASASRGAHSLDPEGLCSSLSDQREMVTRCPPTRIGIEQGAFHNRPSLLNRSRAKARPEASSRGMRLSRNFLSLMFMSHIHGTRPLLPHDERAFRFGAFALRASSSAALFAACFCSLAFRLQSCLRSRCLCAMRSASSSSAAGKRE